MKTFWDVESQIIITCSTNNLWCPLLEVSIVQLQIVEEDIFLLRTVTAREQNSITDTLCVTIATSTCFTVTS